MATAHNSLYAIDPLRDPRWVQFLAKHPQSSIFHTPGWLDTLRRTYAYEPFVLTTSAPDKEVTNGIVLCRIRSWLTGTRLVSLAFSDHCQPLVARGEDIKPMLVLMASAFEHYKCRYIEIRPIMADGTDFEADTSFRRSASFHYHFIDLRPSLDTLFGNFHESCIRRKIHRSEREQLTYEEGRSDAVLARFYSLLVMTRRRQGSLPQPLAWFRNMLTCLHEAVKVRVVSRNGQPVASIITLHYGRSVVYKYGCSDAQAHNLGGMPFLFWRTIQDARQEGAETFDLGRSDSANTGLIDFKRRLGARSAALHYYRYPQQVCPTRHTRERSMASGLCARLPGVVSRTAGKLLYRHVG